MVLRYLVHTLLKVLVKEEEKSPADAVWLKFSGQIVDKKVLTECELLNDRHINFAQRLLRSQFPGAQGLGHTLIQERKTRKLEQGLQIIFDSGNHWIVASNMDSENGTVKVYDSIYTYVDGNTRKVIENLFCMPEGSNIEMLDIQKQEGVKDCGLFSIAIATALLFGEDPLNIRFNQVDMRSHLLKCYDTKLLSLFSVL